MRPLLTATFLLLSGCADILGYQFGDYQGPGGGGIGGGGGGGGGAVGPPSFDAQIRITVEPQALGEINGIAVDGSTFVFAGEGRGTYLPSPLPAMDHRSAIHFDVGTNASPQWKAPLLSDGAGSPLAVFQDVISKNDARFFAGYFHADLLLDPTISTDVDYRAMAIHYDGTDYAILNHDIPGDRVGVFDAIVEVGDLLVAAGIQAASSSGKNTIVVWNASSRAHVRTIEIGPACTGFFTELPGKMSLSVDKTGRLWVFGEACHPQSVDAVVIPAEPNSQSSFGMVFQTDGSMLTAIAGSKLGEGVFVTAAAANGDGEVIAAATLSEPTDVLQCAGLSPSGGNDLLLTRLRTNGANLECVVAGVFGGTANEAPTGIALHEATGMAVVIGNIRKVADGETAVGTTGLTTVEVSDQHQEIGFITGYETAALQPMWGLTVGDSGRTRLRAIEISDDIAWVSGLVGESLTHESSAQLDDSLMPIEWSPGDGFAKGFVAKLIWVPN